MCSSPEHYSCCQIMISEKGPPNSLDNMVRNADADRDSLSWPQCKFIVGEKLMHPGLMTPVQRSYMITLLQLPAETQSMKIELGRAPCCKIVCKQMQWLELSMSQDCNWHRSSKYINYITMKINHVTIKPLSEQTSNNGFRLDLDVWAWVLKLELNISFMFNHTQANCRQDTSKTKLALV